MPPGIIDITEYPTWGTSAAGNSTALNAAVADAASRGGATIYLPGGDFDFSAPITIADHGVQLRGARPAGAANLPLWGTRLRYIGSPATNFISIISVPGSSNYAIRGCVLENMRIDANGSAIRALFLSSTKYCNFRGLHIQGATGQQLHLNVASELASNDPVDLQNCNFEDISIVASGSSHALYLSGDEVGNTSFNQFRNFIIYHQNGIGIAMVNCDNCDLWNMRCYQYGTGYGVVFAGGSHTLIRARTMTFYRLFSSGQVVAQGTESYPLPSYDNRIFDYDESNGTPPPYIGIGATLHWVSDKLP